MKKREYISLAFGLILLSSCYKEEDFDVLEINPDEVILSVEASKSSLVANVKDELEITVHLPPEADDALAKVSFETDHGSFSNDTQKIEKLATLKNGPIGKPIRTAVVSLKSSQSALTATVQVKVAAYSKEIKIPYTSNYADSIQVIPANLSLSSDLSSELAVLVELSSKNGKVSTGQEVSLKAINQGNSSIGTFRTVQNLSNAEQQCNYVFSLASDTSYTGPVRLIANYMALGVALSDTVIIYSN